MILKYSCDDDCIEVKGSVYTVAYTAEAKYNYDHGRMYMPNGDPGYPPEESFEVISIDSVWFTENGTKVEPTEEMLNELRKYLENNQDLFMMEEDEEDVD